MGWAETRIGPLETRVEWILRQLRDMVQQLRAVQQQSHGGGGSEPTLGSGGSGAYFCVPSGTVGGASGTWPSLTPSSFTADVYSMVAGSLTLVTTSATVFNGFPAGLAAGLVCFVVPDNAGNYVVVTQSCT